MGTQHYVLIRICAWSVLAYILVFAVCWVWLAQTSPPFSPDYPTDQLAVFFVSHATALRAGYMGCAVSAPLYAVWTVGMFAIMRRMEEPGYILSYLQLIGGVLTSVVPMITCMFWLTAAFRPQTDPAIIQMLYDLGWMTIDCAFLPTTVQMLAAGVLFLKDRRSVPLFPKWISWFGIVAGLEFFTELLMPFSRSGPFSWTGFFGYWLGFVPPFIWMLVVAIYMIKAATRLELEDLHIPVGLAAPSSSLHEELSIAT